MRRPTHVAATYALAGAVAAFGAVEPDALVVAGGAALGILLHPDQDQGRTPYGWLRKHRGLSHWPVVGTLDRLAWFVGPALAAWALSGRETDWAGLALLAAGLALADLLHIIMDRWERRWKRWMAKNE